MKTRWRKYREKSHPYNIGRLVLALLCKTVTMRAFRVVIAMAVLKNGLKVIATIVQWVMAIRLDTHDMNRHDSFRCADAKWAQGLQPRCLWCHKNCNTHIKLRYSH